MMYAMGAAITVVWALVATLIVVGVSRARSRRASRVAMEENPPARRLVDMSTSELLDEQRKVITGRRETWVVEFVAKVSSATFLRSHSIDGLRHLFAAELERALKPWLPLGGRAHNLPVTRSTSSNADACTLHMVVYMEVQDEADAHEIAAVACSVVQRVAVDAPLRYDTVTFFPVLQSAPLRAGSKPGLWSVLDVKDPAQRRYTDVAVRSTNEGLPRAETGSALSEWQLARANLEQVTREFAKFEFSPMDVALTRRLLWDLSEPATMRFYEAFDAANALLTDTAPSDAGTSTAFVEASRIAVATWEAADRNARNKAEQNIGAGGAVLSETATKHRNTAASALRLALDENTPAPEAGVAWKRSMEALSRAGMSVPPSWQEKMESTELVSRVLKALPAGRTD